MNMKCLSRSCNLGAPEIMIRKMILFKDNDWFINSDSFKVMTLRARRVQNLPICMMISTILDKKEITFHRIISSYLLF